MSFVRLEQTVAGYYTDITQDKLCVTFRSQRRDVKGLSEVINKIKDLRTCTDHLKLVINLYIRFRFYFSVSSYLLLKKKPNETKNRLKTHSYTAICEHAFP